MFNVPRSIQFLQHLFKIFFQRAPVSKILKCELLYFLIILPIGIEVENVAFTCLLPGLHRCR